MIWLQLGLFVVNNLAQLLVILEFSFVEARKGELQVLNRNLKATPKGILDAVNRTSCEDFKFNVLRKWVLGLAAANIRITRRIFHFFFWLALLELR